ncbi:hypothetical protein [Marinobacter nauticus]|uniref:Sulfotransferase domain-containing protein n=1 Tax=Marinobacter nauticus TaxID=2743 RepID=A0A1M2UX41_MARNT|nr:hypothetical protein [Marinobacter nauticus]OJS99850.1 hypothetical protein BEE62_06965 [Marinobacter nauticus]
MTAPKILLHLGLPKTATSSLQHNVLKKLHEQKRINFLGKCLDYNLETKELKLHNNKGKFIRDCAEGKISVEVARQNLADLVDPEKVNVYSDEGIMVAYPGKDNLPLSQKFKGLAKVLDGYSVQVVVTLRDPVDYLYSLYVELYPDYCSNVKSVNSINKYVDKLIYSPEDIFYESFFFDKWINDLGKSFEVSVLSFEGLARGDEREVSTWAEALGVSKDEFRHLFNSKKVNVKAKTGKEVKKIKDLKGLEIKLRLIAAQFRPIYAFLRWAYNASGLKKIFNYRFVSSKTHEYPSGSTLGRLRELLVSSARSSDKF